MSVKSLIVPSKLSKKATLHIKHGIQVSAFSLTWPTQVMCLCLNQEETLEEIHFLDQPRIPFLELRELIFPFMIGKEWEAEQNQFPDRKKEEMEDGWSLNTQVFQNDK